MNIVREYNKYFLCHCPSPSHNDKHASCILWKDSGMYKCMSCGFNGFSEDIKRQEYFRLPDFNYSPEFYPLTIEAKNYLRSRGVEHIPPFAVSTSSNDGVGFLQREINGDIIGIAQRLFMPLAENMRYSYEGKKSPFTGIIDGHYTKNFPIIVLEKMFGMLRFWSYLQERDEGVVVLSSNGSKVDYNFWSRFSPADIVFIMDNDKAGIKTKDFLKSKGYVSLVSKYPSDQIAKEKIGEVINNAKMYLFR